MIVFCHIEIHPGSLQRREQLRVVEDSEVRRIPPSGRLSTESRFSATAISR